MMHNVHKAMPDFSYQLLPVFGLNHTLLSPFFSCGAIHYFTETTGPWIFEYWSLNEAHVGERKTEPLDSLAAEEFPLHTFYWFECFIQLRPDQTSCPVSKGQTRPFAQYNSISSGQNRTSIGRLTWFHPFQTFGPPTSVDNIFWEWCKKMGWQSPTEAKLSTAQSPGTNWTVSPFWDKKKTLLYLLSGH